VPFKPFNARLHREEPPVLARHDQLTTREQIVGPGTIERCVVTIRLHVKPGDLFELTFVVVVPSRHGHHMCTRKRCCCVLKKGGRGERDKGRERDRDRGIGIEGVGGNVPPSSTLSML
jgi:hypothetical protein